MKTVQNFLSRRDFLALASYLSIASLLPGCIKNQPRSITQVVLIMVDDLSAESLPFYGPSNFYTPNLNELAEQGVAYNNFWAASVCSTTRAMLHTGRYPHQTGWYHNRLKGDQALSAKHTTIGQLFSKSGFNTALYGKWQLPGEPTDYGFSNALYWSPQFEDCTSIEAKTVKSYKPRYWGASLREANANKVVEITISESLYAPDIFNQKACSFLGNGASKKFLYYPMVLAHTVWSPTEKKNVWIKTPGSESASEQANIEYMDRLVGQLIETIKSSGRWQDTLIVFSSDNPSAGHGKNNFAGERGARVPLIIGGGAVAKRPALVPDLADVTDLYATFADLLAISSEQKDIDGRSLLSSLLSGKARTNRDWIYSVHLDKQLIRDKQWLIDGKNNLYKCSNSGGAERCIKLGDSDLLSKAAKEARFRLEAVLSGIPTPSKELLKRALPKRRELLYQILHLNLG